MSVKKARGKGKSTAKRSAAAKSTAKTKAKKGKDIAEVRESISDLVKDSAELIATSVIELAKTGQLASAKYLFEATGLYPANEQIERQIETTMAHQLLAKMGLPLEPVVYDEDGEPAAYEAKNAADQASEPEQDAEEDGGEENRPAEGQE